MNSVRRIVPVLAGILGTTSAWGALGVGCSSNGGSPSGGPDATADAEDAQSDVTQVDTSTGTDSQAADTFVADTFVADTFVATDTGTGADADGGTPIDAAPDVYDASLLLAFPPQQAAARCAALAACCGMSVDASTFNLAQCVSDTLQADGFKGSTAGVIFAPYGNINFNAASAAACLNDFTQINCTTDQIPSAAEIQLYQDCFGAYSGTLPVGAACHATIECQPGEYCNGVDGGVCAAVASVGGQCGTVSQNPADITPQSQCSYRGAATNGRFCQEFVTGNASELLDAAAWTCQPQLANGASCLQNQDCQSYQCGGSGCATSIVAFSAGQCATYTITDAGGD